MEVRVKLDATGTTVHVAQAASVTAVAEARSVDRLRAVLAVDPRRTSLIDAATAAESGEDVVLLGRGGIIRGRRVARRSLATVLGIAQVDSRTGTRATDEVAQQLVAGRASQVGVTQEDIGRRRTGERQGTCICGVGRRLDTDVEHASGEQRQSQRNTGRLDRCLVTGDVGRRIRGKRHRSGDGRAGGEVRLVARAGQKSQRELGLVDVVRLHVAGRDEDSAAQTYAVALERLHGRVAVRGVAVGAGQVILLRGQTDRAVGDRTTRVREDGVNGAKRATVAEVAARNVLARGSGSATL